MNIHKTECGYDNISVIVKVAIIFARVVQQYFLVDSSFG